MAKRHPVLSMFLSKSPAIPVALLIGTVLAGPAHARFPKVDQPFLDREIPKIQAMARDSLPEGSGPVEALLVLGNILDQRQQALEELYHHLSPTDLDGIETSDRYDQAITQVLDRVARAGLSGDSTTVPKEVISRFDSTLASLPELGGVPLAFMITNAADSVLAAANHVDEDPLISPVATAKEALRRIRKWTDRYNEIHGDIFLANKADGLRESSVTLRMRCPNDNSMYKLNAMRDKVAGDGSITNLYYLECPVCHRLDLVEYPAKLATRINQASELQVLKSSPKLVRSWREPQP